MSQITREQAQDYTISVRREMVEGAPLFVARATELPDLVLYEETFDAAYNAAIDAIVELCAMAAEDGYAFPRPLLPEGEYSGRFTLRVPKWLHRDLVEMAEREGVSFNQHIVAILSKADGIAIERSKPVIKIAVPTPLGGVALMGTSQLPSENAVEPGTRIRVRETTVSL